MHRHPGADEFVYIIRGHAAAGAGEREREAPSGTAIYSPRDEVHWIRNLSQSEDLELFGGFAGVADLQAAGYEFVGDIAPAYRQIALRP
jgi:quercetin dioxygenase-like cupin family protein